MFIAEQAVFGVHAGWQNVVVASGQGPGTNNPTGETLINEHYLNRLAVGPPARSRARAAKRGRKLLWEEMLLEGIVELESKFD